MCGVTEVVCGVRWCVEGGSVWSKAVCGVRQYMEAVCGVTEVVCGGRWCVEGGSVWREAVYGVRQCME